MLNTLHLDITGLKTEIQAYKARKQNLDIETHSIKAENIKTEIVKTENIN